MTPILPAPLIASASAGKGFLIRFDTDTHCPRTELAGVSALSIMLILHHEFWVDNMATISLGERTRFARILDEASLFGIERIYKRHLSPVKYWLGHNGCAFRVLQEQQNEILAANGRPALDARSCSTFAAQVIREEGLNASRPLMRGRAVACFNAAITLGRAPRLATPDGLATNFGQLPFLHLLPFGVMGGDDCLFVVAIGCALCCVWSSTYS
jgi:hypothetical protein